MTFDPVAYKQAVTQEWERDAHGWYRWIPTINAWLEDATRDDAGPGNDKGRESSH